MIAARNPLPPAQSTAPAADPSLALIEAHRAAYLAWDAASDVVAGLAPGDAGRAEAERTMHDAGQRHRAAFDALASTPPTEPAHLVRLTEHLRWFYAEEFAARRHAGLGLVLGGIEALSPVLTADPIERLSSTSTVLPPATVAGPDPVLALIEAHRAAYATLDRVARAWTEMDPHDPGYEAAEEAAREPGREEREARGALLAARPVTAAGLWALAAYLPEAVRKVSPGPDLDALKALDVLREGALRLGPAHAPSLVLTAATTAGPDPVLAAIAASRAAEAAVVAFHARDDDGPMSPELFDEEKRLCAAQVATRETAWKTPPTTQAGRRALVEFARFQVERHTGHTGKLDAEEVLPEILDAMAAMVEAEGAAATPGPDAEAFALVDAIEREWSGSARLLDAGSPDDAATDAALARREALLDAADRLPATSRAARHAKAMALAWIASTDRPTEGVLRSSYATDASLAFDIAASLTGGAPVAAAPPQAVPATSPGSDLDLSGCSIPDIARLCEVLRATSDTVSATMHVPCFSGDNGWTPAGLILDAETTRFNRMVDACVGEIVRRVPVSPRERDEALSARLAHELACEGRILDAALMLDVVLAWGNAGHTATEAGR